MGHRKSFREGWCRARRVSSRFCVCFLCLSVCVCVQCLSFSMEDAFILFSLSPWVRRVCVRTYVFHRNFLLLHARTLRSTDCEYERVCVFVHTYARIDSLHVSSPLYTVKSSEIISYYFIHAPAFISCPSMLPSTTTCAYLACAFSFERVCIHFFYCVCVCVCCSFVH